ncbi:relaxase [Pedobacter frigidisoli]|uniref:Relaxase n=1 Tax=Pedobacter frigidisoli TaxID=2530455 RepID=A0A4R0NKP6_9SPHI|nr:relaxase/mobilization nuclease domain-containing protein [Pedobacter frigidisoli]TCD00739.1 relaxase [Pedobacter frigidisoli]
MVARILTGKSIRGLINYNESKVTLGTATPILANRFGLDIEQLELRHKVARFEHLTKLNSRIKTNAVHIMLNFDRSENVEVDQMQKIAADYMDRIGFGEQPFLVYKHEDANHPHLHIVTTNVNPDATRIDMHNIGKTLSEKARKEIEIEYKLVKAEGRGREQQIVPVNIELALYGQKETKRSIYNVVTAVLRSYKFTSFAEYNAALKSFNVVADRGPEDSVMFQKNGMVYSILDADGKRIGIPFKASSLAGNSVLHKVEGKFLMNLEKRKQYAEPLKQVILETLEKEAPSKKNFINALEKKGISVVFRQNGQGLIYGITYVDHNSRCVFNGSDLGKAFSAKALLKNLEGNEPEMDKHQAHTPEVGKGRFSASQDMSQDDQTSQGESLLQFLFAKPAQEPIAALGPKRKKKKKKGLLRNGGLSH